MVGRPEVDACGWGGISVELGDRKRPVESIADADRIFREHKLPMNPALLGYQYFHECTLGVEQPVSRAIARTLASTGTDAQDIDMLIVASADFPPDRQFMTRLLRDNGLARALPLAITAQECTGLLSAIQIARSYVDGKSLRNILVVSCDRAKDDAHRIQSFAVLSDAVAACLVTSGGSEFRIRGYSHKSDLRGMQDGDDFASRKSLANAVTADVLAQGGVPLSDVRKVFGTNFFRPVARYNASALGLGEHQLHVDRAPEFGHCLCADPLLNLSEFLRSEPAARGDMYLLQAYAPGFLAAMLIERTAGADAVAPVRVAEEVVEQSW